MDIAETYRKMCLRRQSELRRVLVRPGQYGKAISLLLSQHALLHSMRMAGTEQWSFEDEVFSGLSDEQARYVPAVGSHSIAWLIWHMARCEDIAMNMLVAGTPQVLHRGSWLERTGSPVRDTGNAMTVPELRGFNGAVNIAQLRAYRVAVGRRTRQIVKHLEPAELERKVTPASIQTVMDKGAVVDAARGIADYWSRRDVAGLLLMPATRHNLIHLSEAARIKRRFQHVV